ncbi:hypothetical protein [Nonomuraea candida]|uniref:hypothetical protein n=1 Tax=Nonomuraea candida TaxID=359159 RepID=UPI0012FC8312|nr:hypothetical protein [Nonomuraea candida]
MNLRYTAGGIVRVADMTIVVVSEPEVRSAPPRPPHHGRRDALRLLARRDGHHSDVTNIIDGTDNAAHAVIANTITGGLIQALATETPHLKVNAVTLDKPPRARWNAAKLTATAIDGKTIMGAFIRIAATGRRLEFAPPGATYPEIRFILAGAGTNYTRLLTRDDRFAREATFEVPSGANRYTHTPRRDTGIPVAPHVDGAEPLWCVYKYAPVTSAEIHRAPPHSLLERQCAMHGLDPDDVRTLLHVAMHEQYIPDRNDMLQDPPKERLVIWSHRSGRQIVTSIYGQFMVIHLILRNDFAER